MANRPIVVGTRGHREISDPNTSAAEQTSTEVFNVEAAHHSAASQQPTQHAPLPIAELGACVPVRSAFEFAISAVLPALVPLAHCRAAGPEGACDRSLGQLA